MKKSPNKRAFTLIELLIVSMILSVVSLAIYSSFANGMKIWKRVNAGIPGEEYALFFERFGGEVRAALRMQEPPFRGSDDTISFPVVAYSRRMGKRVVSKVSYSFIAERSAVMRSQEDYSALFTGKLPGATEILSDVGSLKFSYYGFDKGSKRFVWLDDWTLEAPPLAARVEIQRKGAPDNEWSVRTFPVLVSAVKYE